MPAAQLLVVVIVVTLGLASATALAAIILRIAVGCYNKFAGLKYSPMAVPEPETGKAMAVVWAAFLVSCVAAVLLGAFLGFVAAALGVRDPGIIWTIVAISLPVQVLVTAGVFSILLPTSFRRAIPVALGYLLIIMTPIIVIAAFLLLD